MEPKAKFVSRVTKYSNQTKTNNYANGWNPSTKNARKENLCQSLAKYFGAAILLCAPVYPAIQLATSASHKIQIPRCRHHVQQLPVVDISMSVAQLLPLCHFRLIALSGRCGAVRWAFPRWNPPLKPLRTHVLCNPPVPPSATHSIGWLINCRAQ